MNDLNSFSEKYNNSTILNNNNFDIMFNKKIDIGGTINYDNSRNENILNKHNIPINDIRLSENTFSKKDNTNINKKYEEEHALRINDSIDPYKWVDKTKPINLQSLKENLEKYATDSSR